MKFWVKAVVDNKGGEQLLVQVDGIDELRDSLARMLHVTIASLSITDFQTQVVDRLRAGVEIITVWILTQPVEDPSPAASSSHLTTPRRDGRSPGVHGRSNTGPQPALSLTPKSTRRDMEGSGRAEDATTGLFDAHAGLAPPSQPLSRRGSWRERGTPREDGLMEGSASNLFSSKDPLREPCLIKLCLRRDDVLTLLDERFDSKYTADLLGCFLRAKEPDGYGLYQITDIVDGEKPLILLDTVYASESRQLDTISNAAPTSGEVRAWFRKMLSTARPIPSFAMVEAKAGDIESNLRAASSALGLDSPTASPGDDNGGGRSSAALLSTVLASHATPSGSSPAPPDALRAEPTRVAYGSSTTTTEGPPAGAARSRRKTQLVAPLMEPHLAFFHGKAVLRTNDRLHSAGATLLLADSSEGDVAHPSQFWLVARRYANVLSRKTLRGDSAMTAIQLDRDGRVATDVDVCPKGFFFAGVPCVWEGLVGTDQCLALAEQAESTKSSATNGSVTRGGDTPSPGSGSVPPHGPTPFAEEDSGQLVQRFCVLRGPSLDALRWKAQATALLPIPMWAQNEGHDPRILSPVLIALGATLHVFYLVVIRVEQTGSHRPSPARTPSSLVPAAAGGRTSPALHRARHIDAASLSPLASRGNSLGGISPQHRRHSSLMAQFNASETFPADHADDEETGAGADRTSRLTSPNESVDLNDDSSHDRKYALVHACTDDAELRQWTVVNSREPIVYSFDEVPLYTVFALPQQTPPAGEGPFGGDNSVDSTDVATPVAPAPLTLGLAWWDSSCGKSEVSSVEPARPLSSLSRLPLLCFAYHPVEVPAADPYGRSRRGSAMDWKPVMISTTVPCSAAFDDAESMSLTSCSSGTGEPCFFLSIVGCSRSRARGATFHTPVWNSSVVLTSSKE